jgi:phage/plasmid-associated DNA primase
MSGRPEGMSDQEWIDWVREKLAREEAGAGTKSNGQDPNAGTAIREANNGATAGFWRPVTADEVFDPGRFFQINLTTGAQEVFEPPGVEPPPPPPPDDPPPTDPGGADTGGEALRRLRVDIGILNEESDPVDIAAIVKRIAKLAQDEIIREALLQTVRAQTKTSITAMRAQIKQNARQKQPSTAPATSGGGPVFYPLRSPPHAPLNPAEIAARLGEARSDGTGWWCTCPLCLQTGEVWGNATELYVNCACCGPKAVFAELRRLGLIGDVPPEYEINGAALEIGSDIEIAQRVANDLRAKFGEIIFAEGHFWHYTKTHWAAVDKFALRRAVHAYDGATYETPAGAPAAVKLGKSNVESALSEMAAILADPDFFAHPRKIGINCQSGFITFDQTGVPTLVAHDPDHRCRHVLPGRWTKPTHNAEAPDRQSLLDKLLKGIFLGDADANYKRRCLAEVAGSAAIGYATKLLQPKAVVLKGETAENGKSQILDLWRGLLPTSAISSISVSKFSDNRFIVGLVGKHLNAVDELSSSSAITSETFKCVITGEPVSGRDVYRSAVTFRPVAQHVFSTNLLPTFAGGMDRGVQRRLLVLVFNRVIPLPEAIEDIGKRVAIEEPDLLLAWAVAGAARLIKNRCFTTPESSKKALKDWVYGADPVLAWARVRVDPPKGEGVQPPEIKSSLAHAKFNNGQSRPGIASSQSPPSMGSSNASKPAKMSPASE